MALLLDSMLIVEQLRGRWRVKDAKLAPLHAEAMARLRRLRRWSARHVPAQREPGRRRAGQRGPRPGRRRAARPSWSRRAGRGDPVRGRRCGSAERHGGTATTAPGARRRRGRAGRPRGDQLPLGLGAGLRPGRPAGPSAGELRVRILGVGTSQGLPRIACDCADLHLGRPARPTSPGVGAPRLGRSPGRDRLRPGLPGRRRSPPTSTASTPCS